MSTQVAPEVGSRVLSAPQRVGVKVFVEDQEAFDRGPDDRGISPLDSGGTVSRGRSSTYMITRMSRRGPGCF